MPITVNRANPPPYVVTVCKGLEVTTRTWPFDTLEAAEHAYALAVESGQFMRTLQTGRGDMALSLVSLWRRVDGETIQGEPAFWYEEMAR